MIAEVLGELVTVLFVESVSGSISSADDDDDTGGGAAATIDPDELVAMTIALPLESATEAAQTGSISQILEVAQKTKRNVWYSSRIIATIWKPIIRLEENRKRGDHSTYQL